MLISFDLIAVANFWGQIWIITSNLLLYSNWRKVQGPFSPPPVHPPIHPDNTLLRCHLGRVITGPRREKKASKESHTKWSVKKKSSPKNWNRLQIYIRNPLFIFFRPRTIFMKEFPWNLAWVHFRGKSLVFFFQSLLLDWFRKNQPRGCFLFFSFGPSTWPKF